jgi:hypothetical protein
MKKLFTLLFISLIALPNLVAQCNLDFTFINTGSNMTVFFTPPTAAAIAAELGEGTLGAFFSNADDSYTCSSSVDFTGAPYALPVMGNDATTTEQDGFNANQEMLWFYESNDGSRYSLSLSPADLFTTNGYINITDYVAISIDCGSDDVFGCIDISACNYNELATSNDSSCTYAVPNFDCDGVCQVDCDIQDIEGCTDTSALNYNEIATLDNGSCEYETTECILPSSYVENT